MEQEKTLFDKDLIEQLLIHYPKEKRGLLLLQIKSINLFFDKHKSEYIEDAGFRKAVDLMLTEILSGSFVGFLPTEQNKGEIK